MNTNEELKGFELRDTSTSADRRADRIHENQALTGCSLGSGSSFQRLDTA
jgi:hypothetical protein